MALGEDVDARMEEIYAVDCFAYGLAVLYDLFGFVADGKGFFDRFGFGRNTSL